MLRSLLSMLVAVLATLAIFLVLPVLQTIGKPPARDLIVSSVGFGNEPPPPPPVVEEEPPPQEAVEEPKPELQSETPPLDLQQLELALNPGLRGAEGGVFGSIQARLAGQVQQATAGEGEGLDNVFSLADLDQRPRPIFQTPPQYPAELRRRGVAGTVTIAFTVDVDGRVTNPKVERSTDPAFEPPALDAVRQWRFEPGTRKGKAVSFRMRVPITFNAATSPEVGFMITGRLLGSVVALLLAAATVARASGEASTFGAWDDPEFQKQFLGAFGASSELEPKMSQVERDELAAILPLMGTEPAKAIAELELLTTPDASAMLDYALATLFFQEGRLDDAAGYYAAAVRKFPAFRRAHKNLGLLSVRTGDFKGALASLGRVVELGGGDGLTYGLLGYAYGSTEQWVSAESAYRNAVLLQPDLIDWKLGLTQAVFKQQKYGEAVQLCEALIGASPERPDFLILQADAFIGLGQPLQAAQNFEIVRRMGAASPESLRTLGDIYVNESLFDLAASAYAESLAGEPRPPAAQAMRNVEVLAQRGALAEAHGLLAEVRSVYGDGLGEEEKRKALKLQARIAAAEGASEEAAAVLEEIVAADPLDGEALLLLGQHYGRAGDTERAVFYYERAASLAPFEADAKVRQAQLLVGQSRFSEAVPLLKRAQEIKPRDDVGRYLEQIERASRARR